MRTFLILLPALVIGFAPAPLPKRDRAGYDRKRLDGVWFVETIKSRGSPVLATYWGDDLTFRLKDRVTISGREVTFADYAPDQPARWAIQFHGGTNDFDFLPLAGGSYRLLGVYRLEEGRGTLALAFRSVHSGRPRACSEEEVSFVLLTRRQP